MNYKIHIPKGILNKYVKCIWSLEFEKPDSCYHKEKLIPSGCSELFFHLGNKINIEKDKTRMESDSEVLIMGQRKSHYEYIKSYNLGMISVMLRPEAVNPLLGIPQNEITNLCINAEDILGKSIIEISEKIQFSSFFDERVNIIEEFLLKLLYKNHEKYDERVEEAVRVISVKGGDVMMHDIANQVCLSKRQLERQFHLNIGLKLKEFSKVIRFQKVLEIKQHNKDLSITELALEAGYFDQSHFSNEFKSVTGDTPAKYFKNCDAFSDYYSY